jgi:4-oxalocrotonate tautomerase
VVSGGVLPIVQVYLPGEQTDQLKKMVIEKISEAIVAVGCGPIDRVRIVIQEMGRTNQNGTPGPLAMNDKNGNHGPRLHMFLIEGRSADVKKLLADKLAMALVEAGCGRLEKVQVSIQDIPSSAWGIGGKTARDLGR